MAQLKIRHIDFYPDDWLSGTLGLSDAECGIYIRACALIYAHGGPITVDLLRRACPGHGRPFNRALGRLVELSKLERNFDEISSKRCRKELVKSFKRLQTSAENGAKGGRPSGLAKATGDPKEKPDGSFFSRGRVPPYLTKERKKESSYEVPVAARAYVQREAAVHAHDDTEFPKSDPISGWQSLGSILGAPPPPDPPEAKHRNLRVLKHMRFLQARGRPEDVGTYIAAQMSHEPADFERMFAVTEEWITEEAWDDGIDGAAS